MIEAGDRMLESCAAAQRALCKKWFPTRPFSRNYACAAVLKENLVRQLADDSFVTGDAKLVKKMIDGMTEAIANSDLFERFGVHPMGQPVSLFFWYDIPKKTPLLEFVEGVEGVCSFRVVSDAATAQTRKLKARLRRNVDPLRGTSIIPDEALLELFDLVIREITSETNSALYSAATDFGVLNSGELYKLRDMAQEIAYRTTRQAANTILVGPHWRSQLEQLAPDFKIFEDPHLPKDALLFYRNNPEDPLDTSIILGLYTFGMQTLVGTALEEENAFIVRMARKFIGGAGRVKLQD